MILNTDAVERFQQHLLDDLKAIEAPPGAQRASARVIRVSTLVAAREFGEYYKLMKHGGLTSDPRDIAAVAEVAENLQFLMIVAAQWGVDTTDICGGFSIMSQQFRDFFEHGTPPSTTH